jgi:lipopolysaccharide transport system ATP-binding protein
LEVGTGFHPEMTGRENIYLNGAILGMRKQEITRKFDEIVAFSGVERYIDTPVKRYSSGMYVRLAFAVAAHLESEILIVDEVLAVGDADFQKKCLGKMNEVSKGEGRTVLFVSHNMAAVKSLCNKGIVIENGLIKKTDWIENAVAYYLSSDSETQNQKIFSTEYDKPEFTLHQISVCPVGKTADSVLDEYQEIEINTKFTQKDKNSKLHMTYVLNNESGEALFTFSHTNSGLELKHGLNEIKCKLPKGFLNIGTYYLNFYVIENAKKTLFVEKDIMAFNIQEGQRPIGSWMGKEPGFIKPVFDWSIE